MSDAVLTLVNFLFLSVVQYATVRNSRSTALLVFFWCSSDLNASFFYETKRRALHSSVSLQIPSFLRY